MAGSTNFFQNEYPSLDSLCAFGTEGSGNQIKFWQGDTLIKLNSKHREADKEVAASVIGKAFNLDVVQYVSGAYFYQGSVHKGCECHSFLQSDEETYTLAQILQYVQFSVPATMSAVEYYSKTVNAVTQFTSIPLADVDLYLMQILVFDFLICNPDRHLNNIEFIQNCNTKVFKIAPIFDFGQAFLHRSVMPSQQVLSQELHKFKSLPFSRNPKSNLIDITKAKAIAKQFLHNVGGVKGIQALDIDDYYKRLVVLRFKTLFSY